MGKRLTQHEAVAAIARGENFQASALCGYELSDAKWCGVGIAYGEALRRFKEDEMRIRYVVKSYATPIAWRLDDGTWVVPSEKYSHTTSRHQFRVREAVKRATADSGSVITPA
jgi:hypothetical protein